MQPHQEAALKAHATAAGIDWQAVIQGAKRLMPVVEKIAALTPNKYDDAFVLFIKSILSEQ